MGGEPLGPALARSRLASPPRLPAPGPGAEARLEAGDPGEDRLQVAGLRHVQADGMIGGGAALSALAGAATSDTSLTLILLMLLPSVGSLGAILYVYRRERRLGLR